MEVENTWQNAKGRRAGMSVKTRGVTIKEAAEITRLPPKTIRYYEQTGVVPPPQRTDSGYRIYADGDLRRLHMVRRARLLDLSLPEIKELLGYAAGEPCGPFQRRVIELVQDKLGDVDRRIRDLEQVRDDLLEVKKAQASAHRQEHGDDHVVMECVDCRCLGEPLELVLSAKDMGKIKLRN